jgi:hypothetical protein
MVQLSGNRKVMNGYLFIYIASVPEHFKRTTIDNLSNAVRIEPGLTQLTQRSVTAVHKCFVQLALSALPLVSL